MLTKLRSYKINNIHFHLNISNEEKDMVISKCEYVINMVGLNRDINVEPYAYEHFGISIIEAIHLNCIPITVNGGYPSFYIKKDKGYLFNNEKEFYKILKKIIKRNEKLVFDVEYYNNILQNFNQKSFNKNMDLLVSS